MTETRKRKCLSDSGNPQEDAGSLATDQQTKTVADAAGSSLQKPKSGRTLFVRSLPASATTESLTEYFSQSYPLKHATVVLDPQTKQSKGYGFVTFADHEDAAKALEEFNGSDFDGRKLKIEVAEPRHREIDENGGKSVSISHLKQVREIRKTQAQPPKLIIRNLPWSIAEPDQLSSLFRSFGKVKHAVIPKRGTKHSGFGFVVLRGRKNAEKALNAVNGKEVDGRTLAVDWAVEKSVWDEFQNHTDDVIDGKGKEKEGPDNDNKLNEKEDESSTDDELNGRLEDDEGEEDEDDISMTDLEGDEEDAGKKIDEEVEDERNASTVFIRNLPFNATDDSLYEHFVQFGPLRYARVVVDAETDRPRGTAFVCFWKNEDAISCLRDAPKRTDLLRSEDSKPKMSTIKHSVLEDENKDPSGKYTMDGRVLQLSLAVSKSQAAKFEAEGSSRRQARDKDKRRLFLLSEGTIPSNSPLYKQLSPSEIAMRETSAKQRQKLIKSNPMLHISLTRLSVRNIPRNIDSKALKALAREAVVGFAKDVKSGLREPLSKEELHRSTEDMKEADRLRKAKGKGIIKQAKVVFEGKEGSKVDEKSGAGRSRGYGFIEYYSHRSALMGLRWLNGHAVSGSDKKKRLIVEFAIENAQVVKRRQDKEEKSRNHEDHSASQQSRTQMKASRSRQDSSKPSFPPQQGMKRKRSESAGQGNANPMPTTKADNANETKLEKDNQIAKRNRIIAKKRMMRKNRK
ncbi:RNA recognition domain-containing protein-containing protein [Histoplasma capsulatum G186AR]|uniref:RNA recognition domain-containing protein-containing protein n=1 Tax=Ajellomyces capsulatus (strain G186AR / H82 / ATCC MYA-2454 / RMSCC 2432) TaxID=447093 RepID=C0NII1_AJECG|nr:RNA recognition domain-containing protein-containing protein [Histoplasma capsulatum G186AR]EEH08701.1 RNA recognition domain-containing protein-containing protein [Histoplasma capsulatum G186AR]